MIEITGEPGSEIAVPIELGALLNGTTVSSVVLRATRPRGGAVETWATVLEAVTPTSLRAVYTIPAQLVAGVWRVRPFLYVGGVIRLSIRVRSIAINVTPDLVSAP